MDYKVCILVGGKGSRMGEFSEIFNKAMLPLQGKPTICHIIEKFPENIEIIVSVNYKKEQLRTYLEYAYPKRKFVFVEDKKELGNLKGPGFGLLSCKKHLQCPFIVCVGDTLVREDVPEPTENYLGVGEVENTERFCSVSVDENMKVTRIDDKVKCDNKYAWFFAVGVRDYEIMFNALENVENLIQGEIQMSHGLKELMKKGLYAKEFTWFDTGTPEAYKHALENYPDGEGNDGTRL